MKNRLSTRPGPPDAPNFMHSTSRLPKKQPKKEILSIKYQLARLILTIVFCPAYFVYEVVKIGCSICCLRPIDWAMTRVYPNYVNDISAKKEQFKHSFKTKAEHQLLSLSSFVAK